MFKITIFAFLMSLFVFEISPTDLEDYIYEFFDQLEPLIKIGWELWDQLSQKTLV